VDSGATDPKHKTTSSFLVYSVGYICSDSHQSLSESHLLVTRDRLTGTCEYQWRASSLEVVRFWEAAMDSVEADHVWDLWRSDRIIRNAVWLQGLEP
jgi:hypothetical protein